MYGTRLEYACRIFAGPYLLIAFLFFAALHINVATSWLMPRALDNSDELAFTSDFRVKLFCTSNSIKPCAKSSSCMVLLQSLLLSYMKLIPESLWVDVNFYLSTMICFLSWGVDIFLCFILVYMAYYHFRKKYIIYL